MINDINNFSSIIFNPLLLKGFELHGVSWFRYRSQTVHSHDRVERIWQSSSVIINSQTGNGVGHAVGVNWVGGWRHVRKRCPENFQILKKLRSWGSAVEGGSWSDQIKSVSVSTERDDWNLRGDQHSMVSIGPYDLYLSPRRASGWRQKGINLFVS